MYHSIKYEQRTFLYKTLIFKSSNLVLSFFVSCDIDSVIFITKKSFKFPFLYVICKTIRYMPSSHFCFLPHRVSNLRQKTLFKNVPLTHLSNFPRTRPSPPSSSQCIHTPIIRHVVRRTTTFLFFVPLFHRTTTITLLILRVLLLFFLFVPLFLILFHHITTGFLFFVPLFHRTTTITLILRVFLIRFH